MMQCCSLGSHSNSPLANASFPLQRARSVARGDDPSGAAPGAARLQVQRARKASMAELAADRRQVRHDPTILYKYVRSQKKCSLILTHLH